jgi:pyruvate formate lyase activating enzyme
MESLLDRFTVPRTELARPELSGAIRCVACGHRCMLSTDGARGVCRLRRRQDTSLAVPWGYVAGVAVDPIEKKPFFHFLPGARALSFGMLGCNFRCAFCQNWHSSQTLRDPQAGGGIHAVGADELVAMAREQRCPIITSTYNEPLITSEWAHEVFACAHEAGIKTTYVSNGHATEEVLDYLAPVLDGMKVDLKAFQASTYTMLGGRLEAVLETIRGLDARKIWVEVVTLVVPSLNDSAQELGSIAEFIASVSETIPWHVTAFHPDYEMADKPSTSVDSLVEAAAAGRRAGLKFVYAGNLPGRTGELEDTHCPACGTSVIRRRGFTVLENRLGSGGTCPSCAASLAGVWSH